MYRDEEKLVDVSRPVTPGSEMSTPKRKKSSIRLLEEYSRYARRRSVWPLIVGLCIAGLMLQLSLFGRSFAVSVYHSHRSNTSDEQAQEVSDRPTLDRTLLENPEIPEAETEFDATGVKMHFLIYANDVDLDLCRTILTSGILTYPSPSILRGDEVSARREASRFPKISRVLNYLDALEAAQDEELVLIVDGDDVQFQLPVEVLHQRYQAITKAATQSLRATLDARDDVQQNILMGADKRCASAATREDQCYPAPPSPAASDLYGNETDVAGTRNEWFHLRQKYVNPGFIIGPAKHIRKLFERAEQIAKDSKKGSNLAATSEQGLFAKIFSEQERWRESVGTFKWANQSREDLQPLQPGTNYEFGILVDYFSELSHSTMNSDFGRDAQFLTWNDDDSTTFHEQANDKHERNGHIDCPVSVPDELPNDISAMGPPFYLLHFSKHHTGSTYDYAGQSQGEEAYDGPKWVDVPLYTHLCMGTVPVLIHHNGDKQARNSTWDSMWLRHRSNALLQMTRELMEMEGSGAVDIDDWDQFKKAPGIKSPGGAWADNGQWSEFNDICPYDLYGKPLFHRDPKDTS